jgi:hypothetical protein
MSDERDDDDDDATVRCCGGRSLFMLVWLLQ